MKTIDEVCGKTLGSFKKFIERQTEELRKLAQQRKERILKYKK